MVRGFIFCIFFFLLCFFFFWSCLGGSSRKSQFQRGLLALLVTTCVKYEMPSNGPILTSEPARNMEAE